MRWRPIIVAALVCAASAAIALWVLHAPLFGHWLQVRTGTVNEPGPYYGFSQITAGIQARQLGKSVQSLAPLHKAA
ncbi:MAG TPA: hypothetical protein VE979_10720 [Streptosporangiaceae bacterium]|nr:hypothetical protein [Streptosporangiaceae bacterium]